MTGGEHRIWAAVYAAAWIAEGQRAQLEPGKVARAVRAASEATRALRDACAAGTVPDVEFVREVLGDDAGGAAPATGRNATLAELTAAASALVGSRWPAGSVEREPLERALRDVLVRLEPVEPHAPGPLDPTCRACGARLVFSARQRGDGMCGPCHRLATLISRLATGVDRSAAQQPGSSAAQQPGSSAASAVSTTAAPTTSRRLERVRRVNSRRRRTAAAKRTP